MALYQLQKQEKTMIILKVIYLNIYIIFKHFLIFIIITKNDYVNLYMIVESIVPIKRTRRSMAPSPSPAEGQASKPESTAIMSEVGRMNEKNYIYLLLFNNFILFKIYISYLLLYFSDI